jgi:ATP-dependent protease HslVU (ClpYQ) peptidase subunit
MTCIAGAIKNGEVCIGGDAVSIQGDQNVRISVEGKVFRVGEFLVGSSGTVRIKQVMRYLFEPPVIEESDLTAYMVREFIPALRALMKEHGGESETDSHSTEMEGQFLVSARGRLFHIDGAYGVFEARSSYAAIGCAAQEALAAMFTATRLLDADASAWTIVEHGLLAAAEFDTSIRPPFTVMTLTQNDWSNAELPALKSNGEAKLL